MCAPRLCWRLCSPALHLKEVRGLRQSSRSCVMNGGCCTGQALFRSALLFQSPRTKTPTTMTPTTMSTTERTAFEKWWHDEGSGMIPQPGEDAETHVRRICEIAWANGEYKSGEASDIIRGFLKALPTLDCPDFHHGKHDHHWQHEPCPVVARYKTLIERAEAFVASANQS